MKFHKARRKALDIMSEVHDAFHDEQHALSVEKTAIEIASSLHSKNIHTKLLRLACVYHDTSRSVIGSSLLLEPLFDGFISSWLASKHLNQFHYPPNEIKKVIADIMYNESLFSFLFRFPSIEAKILTDADNVEIYSPKRFNRGIEQFENGRFSRMHLNMYVFIMLIIHKNTKLKLHFEKSNEILECYKLNLRKAILSKEKIFKRSLVAPIYSSLMNLVKS